jgi:hypothetical protein
MTRDGSPVDWNRWNNGATADLDDAGTGMVSIDQSWNPAGTHAGTSGGNAADCAVVVGTALELRV